MVHKNKASFGGTRGTHGTHSRKAFKIKGLAVYHLRGGSRYTPVHRGLLDVVLFLWKKVQVLRTVHISKLMIVVRTPRRSPRRRIHPVSRVDYIKKAQARLLTLTWAFGDLTKGCITPESLRDIQCSEC